MYVTGQSVGLIAMVAYALGLLSGASLVAVALARREASLSRWAASLQDRQRGAMATNPAPEAWPVSPVASRSLAAPPGSGLWPVLPDPLIFPDLASFLVSTGQPVPAPDIWR